MPQIIITAGDTLNDIADYVGSSVAELMRLNPQIKNANLIQVNSILNLPDTDVARKYAAGRYVALKAKSTMNTSGNWGAWRDPGISTPQLPAIPNTPTEIVVAGGGTTSRSIFSNPWVLGGIAVVIIALLMNKKGR